jgi:hypothetical protein
MSGMFMNTRFNQPLSHWSTRAVKDMSRMFYGGFYVCYLSNYLPDCQLTEYKTPFDQDISMWDKSSVINADNMFGVSNPKWYDTFIARDMLSGSVVGAPVVKSTHLNVLGWALIGLLVGVLATVSIVLTRKKHRHHRRR